MLGMSMAMIAGAETGFAIHAAMNGNSAGAATCGGIAVFIILTAIMYVAREIIEALRYEE